MKNEGKKQCEEINKKKQHLNIPFIYICLSTKLSVALVTLYPLL